MRLYSYIIARDFGFAPNPFNGMCTLATCKPKIRSTASIGDWVIGTGAKTKYGYSGKLIYAMRVDEVLDFERYWSDPRFFCKRPILNGSLMQLYGDNIYCKRRGKWIQADSHHSLERGRPNQENLEWDTSVNRVLISREFVYFGRNAPVIPSRFRSFRSTGEDVCCSSQGHRSTFSIKLVEAFKDWLQSREKWGLQGLPLEFSRHKRTEA